MHQQSLGASPGRACVCALSVSAFRCGGGARRVAHPSEHTPQQSALDLRRPCFISRLHPPSTCRKWRHTMTCA
uniref:Putative secreted protein n=1 Tax=Anopheles triannulatus TaxID=58253 RepID=A0A2M4B6P9_9DIPT